MKRLTKEAVLTEITGSPLAAGLPPGRTWLCSVCGTRVRAGQPHRTDVYPAHVSLAAMIVYEPNLPAPDGRPVLQVA